MGMKIKSTIKTVVTIVAAVFCGLTCSLTADAQSLEFLDAIKYWNDGRTQQAVKLLEKEIQLNPDNDAAYHYLAKALLELDPQHNLDRAEACMKKAAAIDTGNYWYRYTLASFYERTGRPELATVQFESLVNSFPKKPSLYFDLASSYLKAGEIDKAIAALDRIEANVGKNDMIACTKLDLLVKKNKGDEKEAYEFLEKYCKECPSSRLETIMGEHWQREYRDSLAIACYDRAIEMDDGYAPAYYGRAHSWQGLRQYDKYFSDMSRFMKSEDVPSESKAEYINHMMESPQFIRAFLPEVDTLVLEARNLNVADSLMNNVIGLYFYRTERKELAVEILKQNVNFHPESFSVAFQYLLVLYYSQFWKATVDAGTLLLQRFPEHQEVYVIRASALRALEEYDSAIEDYKAYIKSAPTDSATVVSGYSSLGDLYYQKGDTKTAFDCYKKVLKIAPDNLLALNNYAYFLCLEGKDLRKAREMSRKTIEKEPDNPTYLDTYAWILHKLGQDIEAKAMFKHAMLYGGKESATMLEHYAEVLSSLGENDLASIYLNQAKALEKK